VIISVIIVVYQEEDFDFQEEMEVVCCVGASWAEDLEIFGGYCRVLDVK